MKKKITTAIAMVLMAAVGSAYATGALSWKNTSQGLLGADNSTPLTGSKSDATVGAFAQLIHDVNGDGLNPIDLGNADGAGGDDVVLAWSFIGWNTGFSPANGSINVADTAIASVPENNHIFVRTWDAPSPGGGAAPLPGTSSVAMWYGDSPNFFVTDDTGNPADFNIQGFYTNIPVVVPEPGTLAFIGLGLVTIAYRRLRRK